MQSKTDFYRPVHCILGLPFDAVKADEAVTKICEAAKSKQRYFFSTPNLNFLISSLRDAPFRDSVIRSDLSVADGMPLVWIARVLGIPIQERVAGSSLFEALRKKNGQSLSVYFFGGPNGVAKEASKKLNSDSSGLLCVGYHSPGFGSIEDMSSAEVIGHINRSQADFLVVALGAKKGQAWIEHNLPKLTVPVVSHLGAVVNFVAESVTRAPEKIQKLGLEWFWRIKEEPNLWKRYFIDGCFLLKLCVTRVLPGAIALRLRVPDEASFAGAHVSITAEASLKTIALSGAWSEKNLLPLRQVFEVATGVPCNIRLDMKNVRYVDSACIALLMLMYGHQSKIGHDFSLHAVKPSVRRIFKLHCAEFLF